MYEDVITYPAVRQDLAFAVADDVPAGELVAAAPRPQVGGSERLASSTSTAAARSGKGRKSVAMHVVFQSPERTLTDDDAAALRARIVAALGGRYSAELRASCWIAVGRRSATASSTCSATAGERSTSERKSCALITAPGQARWS